MDVLAASTKPLLDTLDRILGPSATTMVFIPRPSTILSSIHQLYTSLPTHLPVEPCQILNPKSPSYHYILSDLVYFSIFGLFGGTLMLLLLVKGLSLRQKQHIAGPMLLILGIAPLIFINQGTPATTLVHITMCITILMRTTDLYFITPWRIGKIPTMGFEEWWAESWHYFRVVPMSKERLQTVDLEHRQAKLRDEIERSKRLLASSSNTGSNIASGTMSSDAQSVNARAKPTTTSSPSSLPSSSSSSSSSSSPLPSSPTATTATTTPISAKTTSTESLAKHQKRRRSVTSDLAILSPKTDTHPQHWSIYFPQWLIYVITVDMLAFGMSFLTVDQILSFSILSEMIVYIALGTMILFDLWLINYTLMIGWAAITGNLISTTEWPMLTHPVFPLRATSSHQFWAQWHHIFQKTWTSLGLKPTAKMMLQLEQNNPKVKKCIGWKACKLILPMLAVFFFSGLMHEYMVVALWHTRPGGMLSFFMIQGLSTVMSKMVAMSWIGQHEWMQRRIPNWMFSVVVGLFNVVTSGLFFEPVLKNGGFNVVQSQSMLIRLYNYWQSHYGA